MHDDRPPYMPFYWEEFFNDPKVTLLSNRQKGIYLALMRYAWRWSNPPCSLPNLYAEDKEEASEAEYEIRKVLGCPGDVTYEREDDDDFKFIGRVMDCWDLREDGRLYQKRLEFEFNKAMFATKRRVEAAEATNKKKKTKAVRGTTVTDTVTDTVSARSARGDRSLRASNSNSSIKEVFSKGKGGAGGKGKHTETVFSESPLAKWEDFRAALAEWPEEQARFYYDLFVEREGLNNGKYKYSNWALAAKAWSRKHPDEWKQKPLGAGMSSRATAAGEAVKRELARKK